MNFPVTWPARTLVINHALTTRLCNLLLFLSPNATSSFLLPL